jgi:dTDP-4-dehydrorhamnose reductase
MNQIVVIGGNGQLGTDLLRVGKGQALNVVGLTHSGIEITDADSIEEVLSAARPEVVINTAACHGANQYTAADQEAFFRVNALGVWNVARWCWRHEVTLVHYSTDYVFGKEQARERPYTEEDTPCPVNVYGVSKLAGEHFVRAFCPKHYVIRVASLYGRAGCRAKGNSNFVKMVLDKAHRGESLEVVDDQIMSPTWTHAIAGKTLELIHSGASFGLYHLAGSGWCSWYELACEIIEIAGASVEVYPIATSEEEPDEVFLRPRYTALDNVRLRQAGLNDLPDWREALRQYIQEEENK